jgi:hypothetical protein
VTHSAHQALATASELQCPAATVDTWLHSSALDRLEELELGSILQPLLASTFRFSAILRVANIRNCKPATFKARQSKGFASPQLKQPGLDGVHVSERHFPGKK